MPDNDFLEASRLHLADVARLGGLTDEQLDYLARLGEAEDPATDGLECDLTPKLTDEEWQFVLDMQDGADG